MKKKFLGRFFALTLLLCAVFSFVSCKSAVTTSHGSENVAYLEIMGNPSNYGVSGRSMVVQVVLDENDDLQFDAQVNPISKRAVSNTYSYKIAPGAHKIAILFNGAMLVETNVFASANQTKIVTLP